MKATAELVNRGDDMADWVLQGTVRRRKLATLDATGGAELDFDVYSSNSRWIITDILCFTNQAQTQAPYPTVTVYLGGIQFGEAEGASWVGNQEHFGGKVEMTACDTLRVVYAGGVVGSVATVIIEGENYLWR